jgi:BASS family bile acid:Na+ symporter
MQAGFLIELFLPILIILTMLGLGVSLTVADFKQIFVHPRAVLVGLSNQLLFVPLTGILLALLLPLSPETAVGLLIIAAAPGGVSSNVSTYLLGGNSALSISLTTLSNLAAFITLPFWIRLGLSLFLDTTVLPSVPLIPIMLQVAILTLIPISLGVFIRNRWPHFAEKMRRPVRMGTAFLLIVAIFGFLLSERENLLNFLAQAGFATLMLCLITLLLGFMSAWLFKLSPRIRITITIESGIQNVPLALTVAASVLANPLIAITPAAYGLVHIFLYTIILVIVFGPWYQTLLGQQLARGEG